MKTLTVKELKVLRDSGQQHTLLDVREPPEYAFCHLSDSVHIPMGEITSRLHELPNDQPIVVLCHHGMRSLQVALYLERQDFDVANLTGGIEAWSEQIDDHVARY